MSIIIVGTIEKTQCQMETDLEDAGYGDVITFPSGMELLKELGVSGEQEARQGIDVILMNLMIPGPGPDGVETCRRLKATGEYKNIPVVMVAESGDDKKLTEAFEANAFDYLTKPVDNTELVARVRSAVTYHDEHRLRIRGEKELIQTTKDLEVANQRLHKLSLIDDLTAIPNRRHFSQILEEELGRARRQEHPIGLIMIDIDYFKEYNDTLGHTAGDRCLKMIAAIIEETVDRSGDTPARYGGDEFAVILPDTDLSGARMLAREIQANIRDEEISHPESPGREENNVTVSIGVMSFIPEESDTPEDVIDLADKALYRATDSGRNTIKTENR